MFNRIKKGIYDYGPAIISTPGRLASSAGGALFGARKFLEYAYHGHPTNPYAHPFSIITVAANIVINLITRIPALFRQDEPDGCALIKISFDPTATLFKDLNETSLDNKNTLLLFGEDFYYADQDNQRVYPILESDSNKDDLNKLRSRFNDTANRVSEREHQFIISLLDEQPSSGSYCSRFGYGPLLQGLCLLTNIISTLGTALGSYNSGKILCEFIAAQMHEDPLDEDWKYYVIHTVALYFAVSNIHAYIKYVTNDASKNSKTLVDLVSKGKLLASVNKKTASTATIVGALNVSTSIAFYYITNKHSLEGLNQDAANFPNQAIPDSVRLPDWAITLLATSISVASLMTDVLTIIPRLYGHLKPLPFMFPEEYDLILKRLEDEQEINLTSLQHISRKHHHQPILLQHQQQIYLYGFSNIGWQINPMYDKNRTCADLTFPDDARFVSTLYASEIPDALREQLNQHHDHLKALKASARHQSMSRGATAIKWVALPIGTVDAASTGMQGYSSIGLMAHDLTGMNAYGYIIDFAFLCALSRTACHLSFNVKKGVDELVMDISSPSHLMVSHRIQKGERSVLINDEDDYSNMEYSREESEPMSDMSGKEPEKNGAKKKNGSKKNGATHNRYVDQLSSSDTERNFLAFGTR